ncbi:MAG: NFYB/HAP3 family transcription factor subunit [Candidatus Aenigmarchaeota archaeon]|nr:NFYB/HAP3 family transcription factor subunit [Candidatus Aenigmarchaeota archaeon]
MPVLPKAPFEKILKEAAKNIRVSDAAAFALAELAEQIAREIAADAADIAKHANRKTVLAGDVTLAHKMRRPR